jgi:hypothetical protein
MGGVLLALPALDVFEGRALGSAAGKIDCAFLLQQNGAVQGGGSDPDRFWPRALGAIDARVMATTDADRATSELVDPCRALEFRARTRLPLTPGKEPLALCAGRKGTFRDDAFSFAKGGTLRIEDNNP